MGKQLKITIPTGWDEISIEKFQRIRFLNRDDYESDLQYNANVIAQLADVDVINITGNNLENLSFLAEQMEWMKTEIYSEKKVEFEFEGQKYKWKADFNSLTVGELISIETIIDLEDLTYDMSFDVIMAILLRRVKDDGDIEDFDSENFKEDREMFSNFKIMDVHAMLLFFFSGGRLFNPSIQDSLNKELMQKKMNSSQKKSWPWKKK